ncbi:glycoside hydrolase family 6 protein [Sorangium sp. So ce119]|uniref:glycoside hydrolase family 6 protein n=1 Tax=Sorangium sp. So ce119 TaxID=3133279 RepID=UPI003F62C928
MSNWCAVLIAASLAACSGAGENGGDEGAGGASGPGGTGAGAPTGGTGAGTPTGTGGGTGTGTPTGGTGTGTPTGGTGTGTPTGSTGTGSASCPGGVDITAPAGNPFDGGTLFVDPEYVAKVQSSIDMTSDEALKAKMVKVQSIPTAFWLDRIAAVDRLAGHLDKAIEEQNRTCKPVIPVIVVYDLPNRDCFAEASNGELRLENGGAERYKTEFIDKIAEIFAARPNLRIVTVIEPDSLPNLATNMGKKDCSEATAAGYKDGVSYALKKLNMAHVHHYIDAAHSGWLGWPDNQKKGAEIFKEVLDLAGNPPNVRGFATNVANYTQLSYSTESYEQQSNPCFGEFDYVNQFGAALQTAGVTGKHFIIDTSRNGVGNIRDDWGYWCNNIGAGMGERPKANPGGATNLDAFYWVKPPGDSDGTADTTAERFDAFCGYDNADQRAPEAGFWFHEYFVECVKNANPPL